MNKQRINEIFSSSENLQYSSDLPLVKELIESFPYFSIPYAMLSKMLHDEHSIYFEKNLKISAAYIGDREILYKYINEKPENKEKTAFYAPEPGNTIQQNSVITEETLSPEIAKTIPPADNNIKTETLKKPEFVEDVPAFEDNPAIQNVPTAVPEPKKEKHFHDFGNDVLQYPITDYFGQYYRKEQKPTESEESITITSTDPLSGKKNFIGWLDVLENRNTISASDMIQSSVIKSETVEKVEATDLITKFIQSEPKIKPQQSRMYKPEDMAKLSVREDLKIATETLANIYLKQGMKTKAIEIFHQLILKFPEKSNYFAAIIKEIQSEGSF